MEIWCVVVAGGTGSRFGSLKQFESLGDRTVLDATIEGTRVHVDGVVVVVPVDHVQALSHRYDRVVAGGSSRSSSVRNGLSVLPDSATHVLIHDGVRPFASGALFDRVISALSLGHHAVVPVLPVTDTVKLVDAGEVAHTLPRERLRTVQTPQGFTREAISVAHRDLGEASDDSHLAELAGYPVVLVEGEIGNRKITYRSDLDERGGAVKTTEQPLLMRTGLGFDSHRFSSDPTRSLVLCGVTLNGPGLEGHSDADVGLHALGDAVLGACGLGGIGDHFPASDPIYRGADSMWLLETSLERCRSEGYRLVNGDVTLICEAPALAPHRKEMERLLSERFGAPISVKAKRTEGIGAIGRREGIAALASVLMTGV
ncbi:MAG: 2-C-methyl-D-erythritol 2,4-cyclodiphosphate synthase [Acidimicrobiales bacterium]